MCCCIHPSEPFAIRRARGGAVLQLVLEFIFLFLSSASSADGGSFGMMAGTFGIIACAAGLWRSLRYRAAFSIVAVFNILATFLGILQTVILLQRYLTIDQWCCRSATTSIEALKVFLLVLIVLFVGLTMLRLYIALCLAPPARNTPDALVVWPHGGVGRTMRQPEPVVAVGVPIANPTAVVAAESGGLRVVAAASGSGGNAEIECVEGQIPAVISAAVSSETQRRGEEPAAAAGTAP